ncbi:hypothetical protein DI383_08940 [Flavobacteriaceae bacterium LYZ1037]|nr:hypothetical protein DI383_08940 [Flavobacteriaceae bacterium LYZ1037]
MIKLFSKIRKQLLNENKTGRYFKYAIGEIFLVMVGILLALQVNNWNQERQLNKEEAKILKGLHQEFNENITRFDDIYKLQEARRDGILEALTSNIEDLSIEEFDSISKVIGWSWTFDPYQGFYNSVISSGRIELISNDALKQGITRFQDLLNDYKEEEINTMGFVDENLYPYLIDNDFPNFETITNIKERTEQEKIIEKQIYIEIYQSNKFENLLNLAFAYMSAIFTEGPILREEMVSIINLLESEIANHK